MTLRLRIKSEYIDKVCMQSQRRELVAMW